MSNSATPKKPTKKEMFNILLNLAEVQADPSLVEFVEHEIDLLTAKNTRKPSEKDKAKKDHDGELRAAIVNEMVVGAAYTADQLIKACPTLAVEPDLTAAKVSFLMRDLLADGSVTKFTEKRHTYWKLSD